VPVGAPGKEKLAAAECILFGGFIPLEKIKTTRGWSERLNGVKEKVSAGTGIATSENIKRSQL